LEPTPLSPKILEKIARGRRRSSVQSPAILRRRFCSVEKVEGFREDGSVAVALFEQGEKPEVSEARALRHRKASDVGERLLALIGKLSEM
jgi:hypothetical protein